MKIPFHYSSDQAVNGVDLAQLAETLQAQLKEAGINLALKPAPSSTQLDGFRSAKQPMDIGTGGCRLPGSYELQRLHPPAAASPTASTGSPIRSWRSSRPKRRRPRTAEPRRRLRQAVQGNHGHRRLDSSRPAGQHRGSGIGHQQVCVQCRHIIIPTSRKLSEDVGLKHR